MFPLNFHARALVLSIVLISGSNADASDPSGIWESMEPESYLLFITPAAEEDRFVALTTSSGTPAPWGRATVANARGGFWYQVKEEDPWRACQYMKRHENLIRMMADQSGVGSTLVRTARPAQLNGQSYLIANHDDKSLALIPRAFGASEAPSTALLALVRYQYRGAFGKLQPGIRLVLRTERETPETYAALSSKVGGTVHPMRIDRARILVCDPKNGALLFESELRVDQDSQRPRNSANKHATQPANTSTCLFSREIRAVGIRRIETAFDLQQNPTIPCVVEFYYEGRKLRVPSEIADRTQEKTAAAGIILPDLSEDTELLAGAEYHVSPILEFRPRSSYRRPQQAVDELHDVLRSALLMHRGGDAAETELPTRSTQIIPRLVKAKDSIQRPVLRLEYPTLSSKSLPDSGNRIWQDIDNALVEFWPSEGGDFPKLNLPRNNFRASWRFVEQIVPNDDSGRAQNGIATETWLSNLAGVYLLDSPEKHFQLLTVDFELLTGRYKNSRLKSILLKLTQGTRDSHRYRSREHQVEHADIAAGRTASALRWIVHRSRGVQAGSKSTVGAGIVDDDRVEVDLKFQLANGSSRKWELNTRESRTSERLFRNGGVADITGGSMQIRLEDIDWIPLPTY